MTRSVSRHHRRRYFTAGATGQVNPARFLLGLVFVLLVSVNGAAQDDPNAQHLAYVTETLIGEPREIDVPVEVGLLRLEFILESGEGVGLTLLNPLGRPHSLDEPNIAVTTGAGRRSILIWDPRPGQWRVRVAGTGRFTLRVVGQGELFVCCGQIFTRNQVFAFERSRLRVGSRHQVQLFASGYSIENLEVRTIDEVGNPIAPVPFRQNDPSNLSSYIMLLEVPDRPFRIEVSGRDLHGKPFRRILPPLVLPHTARDDESGQLEANPQTLDELERTTTTGLRPVIRARVLAWTDEPLLTPQGSPIGVRLRFRIRFPLTAIYSPLPYLYPERIGQGYTGALNLQVRQATVSPLPAGLTQPHLAPGARANFFADTEYQFVVDLVPQYALWQEKEGRYCIQTRPYQQTGLRERFDRDISSRQRLRFRFTINGSDLEGRSASLTEKAYVPAVWLEGLKREGAGECPF